MWDSMIQTKKDLEKYLLEDKRALGKKNKSRPSLIGDEIWKFEIYLRKHEYYNNLRQTPINLLLKYFYKYLHYNTGIRLGFTIPINVFEYGLRINHIGLIIVNPGVKVGKYCDIHQGVNIGQNTNEGDIPVIGDNVWIGPGAKIFGKIKIGNNIAIGANAVVNKSFTENNITIAGIPAKKIKCTGTEEMITAKNL